MGARISEAFRCLWVRLVRPGQAMLRVKVTQAPWVRVLGLGSTHLELCGGFDCCQFGKELSHSFAVVDACIWACLQGHIPVPVGAVIGLFQDGWDIASQEACVDGLHSGLCDCIWKNKEGVIG